MAHNIATINGQAAYFGTKTAWHNLGQIVAEAQNWQEAMKLAQLDWTVTKVQLQSPIDQSLVNAWGIFRDDNYQMIGAVGDKYTPIQNEYAFNFTDALMGEENGCHYVSAGALGNGEKIFCLAAIGNGFEVVEGDKSDTYLLFTTSHDGSIAAQAKITTVRVVCQNTLNQALSMKGDSTKVRHTKTADIRLEKAKSLISNANSNIDKLKEKLQELSKRKVQKESMTAIMERLYGKLDGGTRIENKIADVLSVFESNDGNAFPEIRGTAYNLLNAITDYTDHLQGTRTTKARASMSDSQIRAESAIFGYGAAQKEDALEIIYQLTANDPRMPEKTQIYIPQHGISDTPYLDSLLAA